LASGDQYRIEDLMSADTFKLLKRFSSLANKSTGSGHPSDREYWYAFLLAINEEGASLASYDLSRWLIEIQKWPDQTVCNLMIEFEFAIGLLEAQAKRRQTGLSAPIPPTRR
jgi:hypothetical protein